MKAAIYHETGGVEVLRYEDARRPDIGADEVLVRVKACSLNALDVKLRSGESPRPVNLPHIGGVDISGVVEETGSGVESVKAGDRVILNPAVKLERGFSIIGVNRHGGFAEYVSAPAENIHRIPEGLPYDVASTLPICYATAIYGLVNRGRLRKGETVVVHAAGSGSGAAAIQIARHLGAKKIIATAGSDEKLEKAKSIGADELINYKKSDFAEVIKGGVDVIFDPVGASYWERNLKILNAEGRLLLVGVVGGGVVDKAAIGPVIMRDISVLGVTVFNCPREVLDMAIELAAGGTVKPVIHKTFPLSEIAAAQKMIEDREQFGKVVVNP